MRTSILNTATTEQMGYGIISFFVYTKSTNQYFMSEGEEGENPEVYSLYFTYFLSDTGLVKRVNTFCLLESFTD